MRRRMAPGKTKDAGARIVAFALHRRFERLWRWPQSSTRSEHVETV